MAEETGQERNLPPTAKRLADARREGQVPRSRDLAHLLLLGGAGAALFVLAAPLSTAALTVVKSGLSFDAAFLADPARMTARMGDLVLLGLPQFLPLLALVLLAAIAAPLAVGGWMFVPALATFRADRLNPAHGIGRMFSVAALVDLAKVMLVALLLAAVGGAYVYAGMQEFAQLAHEDLTSALMHFGTLLALGFAALVATLAATAAIDVPFQIFHHHSKLKMTLEEVKRENRETEGDPHIKARVRSVQREMARKRMMAAVPKADVVVTNPTHFAVAIKYLEGRHAAPIVVAKGTDAVAEKIKELARAHGVPQLEAPPLARALHRHVDLGGEIPAALYSAVAQVLAYVYQLKRFAEGRAARPVEPGEISVPPGLDPLEPLATA
jgi:flagellar biosynthetic protein FlhB